MATVNGTEYDHIDIKQGSTTTKHMLKDATARGDIENLKSAIKPITGNEIIEMVKDAQITNSGSTLDLNGITARAGRNCAIIECAEGDVFTINGTSGTTLRLYAFYNASDPPRLIDGSMAPASATGDNTEIIAPANAKYLAINDLSGQAVSYYGELLSKKVSSIRTTVGQHTESIAENTANITKNRNDIDENTTNIIGVEADLSTITGNHAITMVKDAQIENSGATIDLNGITARAGRNCAIIECTAGDVFTINGTSGTTLRLYAFYNASDPPRLIDGSMAPASATGDNTEIVAPANAKYLAINDLSGQATSYYGKLLISEVTELKQKVNNQDTEINELQTAVPPMGEKIDTAFSLFNIAEITEWQEGAAYRFANETVDSLPTASSLFDCFEITCNSGDVFTLSCNSADTAKAYYFIDSNRKILSIGLNQNYNNKILVTPPGATHLVVNKYKTNTNKCYKGAFVPTNYPENLNINKNLTGNENMMWVGWCYPSAESLKRVRNKLYFGYTTGDGFTGIGEYDFDTERFTKTHLKKGQVDNHNASAVHVFADGTIVCGYASGHNFDNSMHVRISLQPECIETFGDDIALECSGVTSYCQFIEYNSNLYMFYRINDIKWVYRISTDKGYTWSTENVVLQSTAGLKYYCLFTPTTTVGMVRMTMYSNPTASATDYPNGDSRIRMGFLNLSTGKIYNADGSTEVQDTTWTSFNILIDNETNTLNRLRDVAVSDVSRPMILYTVFNGTADGIYKLYDAGNTVTIVGAGAEYLSTTQLGTSWIGTNKIVVIRGIVDNGVSKDSVEIWNYSNGNVSQQETIYQEERGSIPIRNMMPIVDVNGKAFLWARGFHKSSGADRFTNFNTDAKIHALS